MIEFVRDLWEDGAGGRAMLAMFVGLGALLVFGAWAIVEDANHWAAFKVEHNCVVAGRMSGDMITTIGADGKLSFGSTPDKTGWKCDDGVTYWR